MACTVLGTQAQQRKREASSLPSQSLRSRGGNSELSLFAELGGRQRWGGGAVVYFHIFSLEHPLFFQVWWGYRYGWNPGLARNGS